MSKERYLLVSDVDDTLLGDDESLKRFVDWFEHQRDWLKLVYSSGRFYESLLESVRTTPLPEPDAVIGGVGTNIHLHPSGKSVEEWHRKIGHDWDPDVVRRTLEDVDGLEIQPEEFQSDYKISYYYRNATDDRIDALRRRLRDAGIRPMVVYSSNRDLDVLPEGATKGTAAVFLANLWSYDKDHVVVAGNSGNDKALFEHDLLGIVVANAHDELKALKGPRIYHAKGEIAAGVLEGLHHWTHNGVHANEPH